MFEGEIVEVRRAREKEGGRERGMDGGIEGGREGGREGERASVCAREREDK